MRTVVVSGVLTCVALVTAAHEGRCQSQTDRIPAATADGSNFDASGSSKAMGEAASRLKDGVPEKAKKLQQLEADLAINQRSVGIVQKDIDEIVLVLNGAANELAPGSLYRATLEREAVGLRAAASQDEVDLDPAVRQEAPYLRQKVAEIGDAERDAEELRTRLVMHVDLLEALRERLQFAGTAARITEPLKNAQGYLDRVQSVATRTGLLAIELYAHESGVANASTPTAANASTPTAPPPLVAAPAAASTAPKPNAARPLLHRASPQIP